MSLPLYGHTLAELIDVYLRDYLPHKAPLTQRNERSLLRWFATELGSIPLADLTPLILRTWRDSLRPCYAPGTIRHYMALLSTVLATGVDDYEWLPRNPLRQKALKPPAPRGRERCLTEDELARLLAACEAHRMPLLILAVRLALCTGTRKQELLDRQWSDIDFARRLLSVPWSKNRERRAISLVPHALALLEAHQAQSTSRWVFPRRDGLKPVHIDYAWRQARDRAGIVNFTFHDLRHTAGSYLAMTGASLREIQEVLGHKNIATTAKYTHLVEPHTRGVLERMAQRYLAPPPATDAQP